MTWGQLGTSEGLMYVGDGLYKKKIKKIIIIVMQIYDVWMGLKYKPETKN